MPEEDVRRLIEAKREESGPERVAARAEAEQQAARLLDERAGQMNEEEARELISLFNRDRLGEQPRQSRFLPAFTGVLRNRLVENLEVFNAYTRRLWRGDEEEALDALDEIFRTPNVLPAAGRSYPSMIMYLRDPTRYKVSLKATNQGLRAVTGEPERHRNQGKDGYLAFCRAVTDFEERFGVDPRETDFVLAGAMREQRERIRAGQRDTREAVAEGREGVAAVARATYLPVDDLDEWVTLLQGQKRQALLYGPPGTGKTFVATQLASYLAGRDGEVMHVQFHPAYTYEDFIEGLRPVTEGSGLRYEVCAGVFTQFCRRAAAKEDAYHVMVIDELNRADLNAVLGELLYCLEYRGDEVELPYSRQRFSIPENVILLATMNTADRSLALVDFAMRRRFHAFPLEPNRDVLKGWLAEHPEDSDTALRFFDLISERVGAWEAAPGHSYWMAEDLTPEGLDRVWRYELRPYLGEYWGERRQLLEQLDAEVAELLGEEA